MTNFIELTCVFFTDITKTNIFKRKIFANVDAIISVEPRFHDSDDDLVDAECNTLITLFNENIGVVENYSDVVQKIIAQRVKNS